MRYFFTILFFGLLAGLILLVDWDEKLAGLARDRARQTIEKLLKSTAEADSLADPAPHHPDDLLHSILADTAAPAIQLEFPLPETASATTNDSSMQMAAEADAIETTPMLRNADMPVVNYQQQSRALLDRTTSHYHKITQAQKAKSNQNQ